MLIIVVAPSGSGKSTLIAMLKKDFPELHESISFTTRKPRSGEKDGVHYFFTDRETFLKKRDQDEFVEWAEVHGQFYGTSKLFIEEQLKQNHTILLDIDVQGTDNLKKHFPKSTKAIFISPPSIAELEKRLIARGKDSAEVIAKRVQNAVSEMKRKDDFDYVVINDQLDIAYAELKKIVTNLLA